MNIPKDQELIEQSKKASARLPDFLLIGAPKAGTTALFTAIGRHQRVYLPAKKEPSFFSYADRSFDYKGPGALRHYNKFTLDAAAYQELFSACPESSVTGEASVMYLYCIQAPQKAHQWIPQAQLFVILRHPVERAYSQFLHLRQEGMEPLTNFQDAFRASEERAAARWRPWFYYKQRGFYGAHIMRWLEYFPREQLMILFYEDWMTNPAEMLNAIWQRLGLNTISTPKITKENVSSRQPRWPWLNYKMTDPDNKLRIWAQRYLPLVIRDAITRPLFGMNLKPGPKLDPILRREITSLYSEDLKIIEALTGRDLQLWRK